MDIYSMYALRMHLNFSLQYLLLLSFTGIWNFFAIFSKLHFYTNDITVQSKGNSYQPNFFIFLLNTYD